MASGGRHEVRSSEANANPNPNPSPGFWPQRDKAQALTLILPGGAAAEPQAGWARHSVTASGGRYEIVLGLRRTT